MELANGLYRFHCKKQMAYSHETCNACPLLYDDLKKMCDVTCARVGSGVAESILCSACRIEVADFGRECCKLAAEGADECSSEMGAGDSVCIPLAHGVVDPVYAKYQGAVLSMYPGLSPQYRGEIAVAKATVEPSDYEGQLGLPEAVWRACNHKALGTCAALKALI